MALIQGFAKKPAVNIAFAAARGKFIREVEPGTEGAVQIEKKGGRVAHELEYRGISGQVAGVYVHQDDGKFPGTDVTLLVKEPGEPNTFVKFRLKGDAGISFPVLQMLQALDKADLAKPHELSISFNPAGSKFKDKDGVEQVREHAQSTVFVAPVGGGKDDWIRSDREAIPKAVPVIDPRTQKPMVVNGKQILDSAPQEEYAVTLIASIKGKLEALAEADKAALEQAAKTQAGDENFGVNDASAAPAAEAPAAAPAAA